MSKKDAPKCIYCGKPLDYIVGMDKWHVACFIENRDGKEEFPWYAKLLYYLFVFIIMGFLLVGAIWAWVFITG